MIPVKIKLLHENAKVPEYKTDGASGFDFYAIEDMEIPPARHRFTDKSTGSVIRTGVAVELPEGYEIQVRGRSGLAFNADIVTQIGTIDDDYRGEIKVMVWNLGNKDLVIHAGDRIAQGVLAQVPKAQFEVVNELSDSQRGQGGFGHTGR